MQNRYDCVEFYEYDGEGRGMQKVCTVVMDGKELIYDGKSAKSVMDMVEGEPALEPWRKIGGYPLLAQLHVFFSAPNFYATPVKEAAIL